MTIDLLSLLFLLLSLALSLAIVVPLTGGLVRFRANYNPKGLRLDAEGGVQPHTGPVVSTFFGMLKRVYRIEGWAGLYKGLMPTLMATMVLTIFVVSAYKSTTLHHGSYNAPSAGPLGMLSYGIFMMMISLPSVIITYRAIITPHKLPYFKPIYSLRVLLTPTERRRPWLIYLTPGLLLAEILHIAYVVLILKTLRHVLLPALSKPGVPSKADFTPVRVGVYFTLCLFSTAVLTPLEVIATRLAIQRNHAAPEFNSVVQEAEGEGEEFAEYSDAEEDVIGLRNEDDPYLGMIDCARRIVAEEGYRALYRAWWLTLLGPLGGTFSG
ncbi:hypothetical protein PILCRDRAFT_827198 [Piloderma croceum F 1598]|uniref:Mitochondrial carrier n=1 Tax=Piloderma croceum (strain F 1598) TaxID=765440 RepID=A0A0C3ESE4_PILCF|nr:hypothetical protein PILCRDRAFT_827198 [Piloderma croceum F 1598]